MIKEKCKLNIFYKQYLKSKEFYKLKRFIKHLKLRCNISIKNNAIEIIIRKDNKKLKIEYSAILGGVYWIHFFKNLNDVKEEIIYFKNCAVLDNINKNCLLYKQLTERERAIGLL
jgi:hypothetical protein